LRGERHVELIGGERDRERRREILEDVESIHGGNLEYKGLQGRDLAAGRQVADAGDAANDALDPGRVCEHAGRDPGQIHAGVVGHVDGHFDGLVRVRELVAVAVVLQLIAGDHDASSDEAQRRRGLDETLVLGIRGGGARKARSVVEILVLHAQDGLAVPGPLDEERPWKIGPGGDRERTGVRRAARLDLVQEDQLAPGLGIRQGQHDHVGDRIRVAIVRPVGQAVAVAVVECLG
jgi:hypothetical protein